MRNSSFKSITSLEAAIQIQLGYIINAYHSLLEYLSNDVMMIKIYEQMKRLQILLCPGGLRSKPISRIQGMSWLFNQVTEIILLLMYIEKDLLEHTTLNISKAHTLRIIDDITMLWKLLPTSHRYTASYVLVLAKFRSGLFFAVIKDCNAVISEDHPHNLELINLRFFVYRQLKHWQFVLEDFHKLNRRGQINYVQYFIAAEACVALKYIPAAVAFCNVAIELNPDFVPALVLRGDIAISLDDANAVHYYELALQKQQSADIIDRLLSAQIYLAENNERQIRTCFPARMNRSGRSSRFLKLFSDIWKRREGEIFSPHNRKINFLSH